MISLRGRQAVQLATSLEVLTANHDPRLVSEVLADFLADLLRETAPDPVDAQLAADELNHRIKQRLKAR